MSVAIPKKKKNFFSTLGKQYQLMIMSVPMLLYVLLFNYSPLWGWITAFQDYKPKQGLMGSKWVGLDNFKFLFGREDFILAIRNTLAMSVINLVFGTVSAVLLAILLNEVRNRAGLTPVTATTDSVLDERRAELALEEDRFLDLVRTGRAAAVLGDLGYVEGKHNLFPIPSTQLQLNEKLKQNNNY